MQFTSINSSQSDKREIKYGVLQGSFLRPLLLLISFINDLYKIVVLSTVHHFADDTKMHLIAKQLKRINRYLDRDLKLVFEWIKANKLSINTSKTELMIFKSRHKKVNKHLNFRINGKKLQPSSQIKYLGVILQDDLHWTKHLVNLKKESKLQHWPTFEDQTLRTKTSLANNILFIIQFLFNLCL